MLKGSVQLLYGTIHCHYKPTITYTMYAPLFIINIIIILALATRIYFAAKFKNYGVLQ